MGEGIQVVSFPASNAAATDRARLVTNDHSSVRRDAFGLSQIQPHHGLHDRPQAVLGTMRGGGTKRPGNGAA